jgi:hypothetical protein
VMASKTLLVGLIGVWLAVHPDVAAGQELWHGATVGMSLADVQKRFPTAKTVRQQDQSRPDAIAQLQSDKTLVDGVRQTIVFSFDKVGLVGVVTSAGGKPDPTALTAEDVQRTEAALRSRYGAPVRCDGPDNNMLSACFWHSEGLFIGFMYRSDPLPMFLTFHHAWEERDGALLR